MVRVHLSSCLPYWHRVYEEMRTFLFVVVHLPLLGLRTRSLYISTFKSRWIVRGVVPNSSTSSWVVTVPFSLMYIYTDLMRVSIRCVEGFKRPLPILASFAWHNRPLADERCLCLFTTIVHEMRGKMLPGCFYSRKISTLCHETEIDLQRMKHFDFLFLI